MSFLLPTVFVLAVWWASTSILMYRIALPRRSWRATAIGVAGVAALGLVGVMASLDNGTVGGVYLGFAGALAIWAGHEASYLLGLVSGPRPVACPPATGTWRRFALGVQACLYHEIAIVLTAALLALLSLQADNRVALWTFVILWLMRWSAKLNIFLGVRNLHREYWPEHLHYLQSFVRERPMNALFPVSMVVASGFAGMLAATAVTAPPGPERAGAMLLTTILALAVIEHACLMLRVPDDLLWRLGNRPRRSTEAPTAGT